MSTLLEQGMDQMDWDGDVGTLRLAGGSLGSAAHPPVPWCSSSCRQQVRQVPPQLPEVLLLVPGKIYQVPQQKRLHHGKGLLVLGTQGVVNSGGPLARVG